MPSDSDADGAVDRSATSDDPTRWAPANGPETIGVLFLIGLLAGELPIAAWAAYIHGP